MRKIVWKACSDERSFAAVLDGVHREPRRGRGASGQIRWRRPSLRCRLEIVFDTDRVLEIVPTTTRAAWPDRRCIARLVRRDQNSRKSARSNCHRRLRSKPYRLPMKRPLVTPPDYEYLRKILKDHSGLDLSADKQYLIESPLAAAVTQVRRGRHQRTRTENERRFRLSTVVGLTDVFKPFPDKRGLYRPTGTRAASVPAATAMPKIAAIAGR